MNPQAAHQPAGLAEPICCAVWAAISVSSWTIALIVLSATTWGF
jgi:hypothetical protein